MDERKPESGGVGTLYDYCDDVNEEGKEVTLSALFFGGRGKEGKTSRFLLFYFPRLL